MSTALTPIMTEFWVDPQSWTLATYVKPDGYQALQKAVTIPHARRVPPAQPAASRGPRLPAVPAAKPEVKFKPIPSKRKPVESQSEETLAPIVSASSFFRPPEKSAAAAGTRLEVSVAPRSPWMQAVEAVQPEASGVGFQPAR